MMVVSREVSLNMIGPLLGDVRAIYIEHIEDQKQEIQRLNKELTGTEETAPLNAAEVKHTQDTNTLEKHYRKIEKLGKQRGRCQRRIEAANEELFTEESSSSENETERDAEDDKAKMDRLKMLKDHAKGIDSDIENLRQNMYAQVSKTYNKTAKVAAADKMKFPKGISKLKKKRFIIQVKQYLEERPEHFCAILPEARRAMDDLSKRTGVHYSPSTWDEVGEEMRDEFKVQNENLYNLFKANCNPQEFTVSRTQYTFGLSGLEKTMGKCEEGDGVRVLHYWLSHLSKVSNTMIEEVETDINCLPIIFGLGGTTKIIEAVATAEELIEKGEELDCVAQYKTVLQICNVLVKKNTLFLSLQEKYIRPKVVAERRNALVDLGRHQRSLRQDKRGSRG
jgi:hypothetical protein